MAHSKLSKTCEVPSITTSNDLSYSLPQISQVPVAMTPSCPGRVPSKRGGAPATRALTPRTAQEHDTREEPTPSERSPDSGARRGGPRPPRPSPELPSIASATHARTRPGVSSLDRRVDRRDSPSIPLSFSAFTGRQTRVLRARTGIDVLARGRTEGPRPVWNACARGTAALSSVPAQSVPEEL